ncbi:MAG: helix-turn-helix transcriptional regulator [Oscillospiraceae bacterium]|nr:helix-turn-helix transcriptional regulator [Oscillospiraceae bacterium]
MEQELTNRLWALLQSQKLQPVLRGHMVSADTYIPEGRRIAMLLHNPTGRVEAHTRDYVELLYQCAGRGVYQANDRTLELNPGDLMLLGQNTLLTLPEQERNALTVRFLIKPDLFGAVLIHLGTEESPLREFLLRCMSQETPYGYLHFRVGGMQVVENLVENLILHLLDRPDSRQAIPMYTTLLLFMNLVEQTDKLTIGIREQMTVLRALQYIEVNYANANLTLMAQGLHSDVSWLSREIRRRTGRTFTELVQERRLNQAAWLLCNTRQKVSDIALAVGYENISYFHRIFAKHFGCTPKDYRDSHK